MIFERGPQVALLFMLLILLAGFVRVLSGFWSVSRAAKAEWPTFERLQPKRAVQTSETAFRKAYVKAYAPHGMAMSLLAIVLSAAITPLAMIGLTFLYHKFMVVPDDALPVAHNMAQEMRNQLRRDGPIVRAFFMFFGLLASWSLVSFFLASLYHRWVGAGKDKDFRAIRGLDGSEAQGDANLPAYKKNMPKRKRPSWSPLVESDDGELVLSDDYKKED